MAKRLFVFLIIVYISSLLVNGYAQQTGKPGAGKYSYTCFQNSDKSWGYDILQAGKVFIHQPSIPAVPGLKGFTTKTAATKVAELVLTKLNTKPNEFPTIDIAELKQLKVINL